MPSPLCCLPLLAAIPCVLLPDAASNCFAPVRPRLSSIHTGSKLSKLEQNKAGEDGVSVNHPCREAARLPRVTTTPRQAGRCAPKRKRRPVPGGGGGGGGGGRGEGGVTRRRGKLGRAQCAGLPRRARRFLLDAALLLHAPPPPVVVVSKVAASLARSRAEVRLVCSGEYAGPWA
jgi:hypothetical protein